MYDHAVGMVPDFNSDDWLRWHHETKLSGRTQFVQDLGLLTHSRLLDVGCGPGLWLPLFRHYIGPAGFVVGADISYRPLTALRGEPSDEQRNAHVVQAQAEALPFRNESFDVVFAANSLEQMMRAQQFIREAHRVVSPNGMIALREFDGATIFFHPVDRELQAKVQALIARTDRKSGLGFDYYAGRSLLRLLKASEFDAERFTSVGTLVCRPMEENVKRFVAGIADWQLHVAAPRLSSAEANQWRAWFDLADEKSVLNQDDFVFHVSEFTAVGRKRS